MEQKTITLADGKQYNLQPFDVNMSIDLQRKHGVDFYDPKKHNQIEVLRYIVYQRLRGKYPQLTELEVGRLLTLGKIVNEVNKIIRGEL